jgi:hypothetical protein
MAECYNSYRKPRLKKLAYYLLKQQCCDDQSCTALANDLQDLQFKCNDVFGEMHNSEKDAKGNIEDTLCSQLRDKKIEVSNRFSGGKVMRTYKRKIQKLKKTKNTRKNKKKSRKTK